MYMHIPIVNWNPRVSVGMEPYSRINFNFRYTTGCLINLYSLRYILIILHSNCHNAGKECEIPSTNVNQIVKLNACRGTAVDALRNLAVVPVTT